jgi:hypothetical protein
VGGTPVITEDGERGFWIDEQQEKFLLAWGDGDFSIFDKISAHEWRLSISEIDLNKTRQGLMSLLGSKDLPKIPERLVERVDHILTRPEAQETYLSAQLALAHADRQRGQSWRGGSGRRESRSQRLRHMQHIATGSCSFSTSLCLAVSLAPRLPTGSILSICTTFHSQRHSRQGMPCMRHWLRWPSPG